MRIPFATPSRAWTRGWASARRQSARVMGALSLVACLGAASAGTPAAVATNQPAKPEHAVNYYNDVIAEEPWSIHVVRIQRARHDFEFTTSLGRGEQFGMTTVSTQLALLPPSCGKPIAAINGDFYLKSEKFAGRPRDLQILQGEVVSSPAGHACFWVDPAGNPQMTNVFSQFRVLWDDGRTTSMDLNEERKEDSAVLYTAAVGHSSKTSGGVELILEAATSNSCPPLRIGQVYSFRVKAVSSQGDSPITRENPVLSLGPKLASRFAAFPRGSPVRISLKTIPDLSGATAAIGGGPSLVRDGKVMEWTGFFKMRHPRTALGWNAEHFFMVEVDGRQSDLSIGMTFPELAGYMLKLGCREAMNLDGGGSATLWFLGTVRNSPSEGQERPAANALVLVKKQPPAKAGTE